MSFICAICGVDFDIEAGECPKCGSNRKIVTIREKIDVKERIVWVQRVLVDPEYRERWGLRVAEVREYLSDDGSASRDIHIIDAGHGIEHIVLQVRGADEAWGTCRLSEKWLDPEG